MSQSYQGHHNFEYLNSMIGSENIGAKVYILEGNSPDR